MHFSTAGIQKLNKCVLILTIIPREWSRKLEKKSKRTEGRVALMERTMRENRRHAQKQKPDPDQDFSNLTLELQSQEERLAALQAQRDELLIGLKGLQESLKSQALRVTRLEGRLEEVLQLNGEGKPRGLWRAGEPLNSDITPQEYYEPRRRSQTHRRVKTLRILDGHPQPRQEGISYSQTDNHSQGTAQSRNPQQPHQYQAAMTLEQTPTDYLPQPEPYRPQSQIQKPAQTRPYPVRQEAAAYPKAHIQPQLQQPQLYHQRHHQLHNRSSSWPQPLYQAPTHPEPTKGRLGRTRPEAPQPRASEALPRPQSESYQPSPVSTWAEGDKEERNTKVESSVLHNLLQLPVRQKIPAQPVRKKHATSK